MHYKIIFYNYSLILQKIDSQAFLSPIGKVCLCALNQLGETETANQYRAAFGKKHPTAPLAKFCQTVAAHPDPANLESFREISALRLIDSEAAHAFCAKMEEIDAETFQAVTAQLPLDASDTAKASHYIKRIKEELAILGIDHNPAELYFPDELEQLVAQIELKNIHILIGQIKISNTDNDAYSSIYLSSKPPKEKLAAIERFLLNKGNKTIEITLYQPVLTRVSKLITTLKLEKLRYLFLWESQIISLPTSISTLKALRTLDVSKSQIQSLPESLAMLDSLQELRFHGTPFILN